MCSCIWLTGSKHNSKGVFSLSRNLQSATIMTQRDSYRQLCQLRATPVPIYSSHSQSKGKNTAPPPHTNEIVSSEWQNLFRSVCVCVFLFYVQHRTSAKHCAVVSCNDERSSTLVGGWTNVLTDTFVIKRHCYLRDQKGSLENLTSEEHVSLHQLLLQPALFNHWQW